MFRMAAILIIGNPVTIGFRTNAWTGWMKFVYATKNLT